MFHILFDRALNTSDLLITALYSFFNGQAVGGRGMFAMTWFAFKKIFSVILSTCNISLYAYFITSIQICIAKVASEKYLLKANIMCILSEALSADIQGILPDKSMPVATHTAENKKAKLEIIQVRHTLIMLKKNVKLITMINLKTEQTIKLK